MNRIIAVAIIIAAGLGLFLLSGCGRTESPPGAASESKAEQPLPPGLFLTTPPSNPRDVIDAKKEAKEGDDITLRGQIAGKKEPFVTGQAQFLLADMSLKNCDITMPEMKCKTPWDFCRENPDAVMRGLATIRILGEDGRVLKHGLYGANGLKHLAPVLVTGKVAKRDDAGNLVVNASGIYVTADK